MQHIKTKIKREEDCEGCIRRNACLIPPDICPCKLCLVRATCKKFCYERHLVCANYLNVKPISEEEFSGVGLPYV